MPLKLSHQLKQKLYLSHKLQQSLTLLTMDNLSLETFIDDCLLSNPCLERNEESEPVFEPNELYDDPTDWSASVGRTSQQDSVETQVESHESLQDSLIQQINCMQISPSQRQLAYVLIASLENDGYLGEPLVHIADRIGANIREVEHVLLDIVQQLDPAGVGARNLHECLLLQFDDQNPLDQWVKSFLIHHADLLVEEDIVLSEKTGFSLEDIQLMRQRLRRLTPSPAGGLFASDGVYVKPEIVFHVREHDQVEVEVPDTIRNTISLNSSWQNYTWKGTEKKFMSHAWSEARSLVHALEQRRETMFKLGYFLAEYQKSFIQHGVAALRPLVMNQVATALDLHESTISRVVSSKYAQTPLGLIHLKCFFSNGLSTNSGQDISIHCVKQRIQALVSAENIAKPISDQKITLQLKSEGIEIARRTVAKYRESLGIPTSTKRRQGVS